MNISLVKLRTDVDLKADLSFKKLLRLEVIINIVSYIATDTS